MPRYTGWTTVIDGTEKKHRSENKTFEWLCEQAKTLPDGTAVEVKVQEPPNTRWYTFDRYVVRGGMLGDV